MPRNPISYLRHRSPRSQYRSRIRLAAVIATSSLLCASSFVLGQGAKVMVLNDENESPIIAHFSMPDLASLREPDFMKRDLPRFKERLMLSDAQVAAFEAQIDAYLEAFEKLMLDLLNVPGAKPLVIKQMIDDGEGGQKRVILGPENLDDLPAIKLEDLKLEDGMPAELGLDVNVRVGGPEGEEDQGDGPRVSVAFRAADGEEIPEEVRQKLEQQAAEMAEKIRKQIEEQQGAEGPNGAVAVPGLPGMNPESLEKMQQDQERFAAAAAEFRKAKSDLRQNFVAEAHTKLSEPQVERWQGLERALLRDRSLPKGRLSGERTDLFKAVEQIEVPAQSGNAVQTELEAYEVALDHALRQRDDYLQDMDSKLDKAMQERNFDRALTMIDRGAALRIAR